MAENDERLRVAEILRNALRDIEDRTTTRTTSSSNIRLPPTPLPSGLPRPTLGRAAASQQDFRNAFPSLGAGGRRVNQPPPKKAKKSNYPVIFVKDSWTRDFCLLASPEDCTVPSFSELMELNLAGLGKKRIKFSSKDANHLQVRETVESAYPKLKTQNGAFEFLRAERGGKNVPLTVIPLPPIGYDLEHVKEHVSTNTVIYVRPMQSCLSKTKLEEKSSSLMTKCNQCKQDVAVVGIRDHIASCGQVPPFNFDKKNGESDCEIVPGPSSVTVNSQNIQSTASCFKREDDIKKHASSDWMVQLTSMFPGKDEKDLDEIIKNAESLEEAVNTVLDIPAIVPDVMDTGYAKRAFTSFPKQSFQPKTVNSFLTKFVSDNLITGYEEMAVEREALWQGTLRFYKRKMQEPLGLRRTVEILFKGEEGIDGGAMRSEFFLLAMQEAVQRLFEGDPLNLVPIRDTSKFILFRLMGMMIVHLIVQNGPIDALPTLAPSVVETILGGGMDEAAPYLSKHQIPLTAGTEPIHNLIEELDSAKNEEDIKGILYDEKSSDVSWQIISNCHWPAGQAINMKSKDLLIQHIIYSEVIANRREEIKEVANGLDTLSFLCYARKFPEFFHELLTSKKRNLKPFNVADFKENVITGPKSFAEKQAVEWLYEFLERKDNNEEFFGGSRLKALLMFCTGLIAPPRYGFKQKIQIKFQPDDDEHELPTSSACLHILSLPTVHSSKKKFFQAMDAALKHAALGFPNP